MDRREVLQMLGAATMLGLLPDCSGARSAAAVRAASGPRLAPGALVLSPEQLATVVAMSDRILPATDTPGAVEAKVPEFIDFMVAKWFYPEERDLLLKGLAEIDGRSQKAFGAPFARGTSHQQDDMLTTLDRERLAIPGDLVDAVTQPNANLSAVFYGTVRRLTLVGYETSKIGSAS